MPKVTIVQVIYNNKKFIKPVFDAIFKQTFKDFNVVAVIAGNSDGGKEFLAANFPQVEIIDPGFNIGFAAGHNLVFEKYTSEFFQLVNPDLVMNPNYIKEMLKVFADERVGAATGKLYQIEQSAISSQLSVEQLLTSPEHLKLDTTGVTINKSGRARDRGQHEVDNGQYDKLLEVDAVSGAGCMYRRTALQATSYKQPAKIEYFDEDFHSYWEDIDLAWRMKNNGWKNIFVPTSIGYHGRGAGSSAGGYKNIIGFIAHHKKLSPRIRQLNYKNHILMYIKNSKYFYPQFFVREFFMFWYVVFFEPTTLKILPITLKLIPKVWSKRQFLIKN